MASQQESRRDTPTDERASHVEKNRVPKMTTHFESLAEKDREGHEKTPQFESLEGKVGGVEFAGGREGRGEREKEDEEKKEKKREGPSLEEISKYRATAQQNSMEAIRAAEERYEKAKESGVSALRSVKDTALEKGQQGYVATKDTVAGGGKTTADYTVPAAKQAKDYTVQKAVDAKNVVTSAGGTAAHYVGEKAVGAKDGAVDVGKNVASYAGEKAVAAKDVTVETGKGTAGYAGKVAADVKDRAVVAGWGATQYTSEKSVEATKAAANVTSGIAGYAGEKAVAAKDAVAGAGQSAVGYAGEKAVAAKDVVAGSGQSAVGYAGEKLAAATDAVVATEESAKEYAARKRAEAEKEIEAKKSTESKGETGEEQHGILGGTRTEEAGDLAKPTEKVQEEFQEKPEHERTEQPGGGVLQAVGETIVEIGQTTKELLVGRSQTPVKEQGENLSRRRGRKAFLMKVLVRAFEERRPLGLRTTILVVVTMGLLDSHVCK